MIENLKQIEDKLLLQLLAQPEKWKTLKIDYFPPIVERCWTQLGNYRIYLHFIHKCEIKDALFHPHPWPSAMHVLTGKYEMGLGYGPGLEPPPIMCTLLLENGGAYYDMTHLDGWHYVRPVEDVCATVMLTGKPWGREQIESPEELQPLDERRKLIMLDWFYKWYKTRMELKKNLENKEIKKGDWVEIDVQNLSDFDKRGIEQFIGKMGFVIHNSNNMIDVRFGNDRTQIPTWKLKALDPTTKPTDDQLKNMREEKKNEVKRPGEKIDDMDPKNWEDDDEEI
jgi:hypothetical protein